MNHVQSAAHRPETRCGITKPERSRHNRTDNCFAALAVVSRPPLRRLLLAECGHELRDYCVTPSGVEQQRPPAAVVVPMFGVAAEPCGVTGCVRRQQRGGRDAVVARLPVSTDNSSAAESAAWATSGSDRQARTACTRVALGSGPMCFSPQADAAGAGGHGNRGRDLAPRTRAARFDRRRAAAAVRYPPTRGGVRLAWPPWRGFPSRGSTAKEAYVVFADAVLPALVPEGFTLLERDRVAS
jgi:hypothetical protein